MNWLDLAEHLAIELLRDAWHALEGHAIPAAKAEAKKVLIARIAKVIATTLDRLPHTVVGAALEHEAQSLITSLGSAAGLSHDDLTALYKATCSHLLDMVARKYLPDIEAGPNKLAETLAKLPPLKAIP